MKCVCSQRSPVAGYVSRDVNDRIIYKSNSGPAPIFYFIHESLPSRLLDEQGPHPPATTRAADDP